MPEPSSARSEAVPNPLVSVVIPTFQPRVLCEPALGRSVSPNGFPERFGPVDSEAPERGTWIAPEANRHLRRVRPDDEVRWRKTQGPGDPSNGLVQLGRVATTAIEDNILCAIGRGDEAAHDVVDMDGIGQRRGCTGQGERSVLSEGGRDTRNESRRPLSRPERVVQPQDGTRTSGPLFDEDSNESFDVALRERIRHRRIDLDRRVDLAFPAGVDRRRREDDEPARLDAGKEGCGEDAGRLEIAPRLANGQPVVSVAGEVDDRIERR